MTARVAALALAILAAAGGLALAALAEHRALEVLGFAAFVGGAGAIAFVWAENFARAGSIEHVVAAPDNAAVVIADQVTSHQDGNTYRVDRLTTWRLRDGARLAHVGNEPGLGLLGAARDGVWCSSPAMAVHVRDPLTLAVLHDERAIVGASGVALKRVTETPDPDAPVFDPASGGVHAFAGDGRGYLISPDLSVVEAPRPTARTQRVDLTKLHLTAVPPDVLARVVHAVVTPERVLLVVGPSLSKSVGSGRGRHSVGGGEGRVAIAIDTATGAVAWRRKL